MNQLKVAVKKSKTTLLVLWRAVAG